jgi:hypothetical protein
MTGHRESIVLGTKYASAVPGMDPNADAINAAFLSATGLTCLPCR